MSKNEIEPKLHELLSFAKKNGLMEISWKENGMKISFRRSAEKKGPVAAQIGAHETEELVELPKLPEIHVVRSPIVGTFRRAVSKNHPPIVMEGNHIKSGERLGVVECMKIPTDVVSFNGGEIKKIMVEDGQPVEYGQPLFEIAPLFEPA